jgi:hypothetical protein
VLRKEGDDVAHVTIQCHPSSRQIKVTFLSFTLLKLLFWIVPIGMYIIRFPFLVFNEGGFEIFKVL